MPELSRFFGIIITMYYNDHAPAHFHARYGSYRMLVDLETLAVIEGSFPPRALGLVMEWSALHRDELRGAWELACRKAPLPAIAPLE